MANDFGITVDEAVSELATVVEEAHEFMVSEFSTDWEFSEAYYAGRSNLPTEEGRSSMVKTECRDVIRALMPNVMRTIFHGRKAVKYMPASVKQAAVCDQQSLWINQHFLANGGYRLIYDAALESMKLKAGPIKVHWIDDPDPEFFKATAISAAELLSYQETPDLIIDTVEQSETDETLFDITGTRYYQNGKIHFEAFPIYEFFVQRNASNLENYVHGHRRSVTVSEALEMGLEYDNWDELDNDDPEDNEASGQAEYRRGYTPNESNENDADLINREFLLTEAYCKFDLDGDSIPEKYVFYLGGTSYKYIHHEQVEDFAIDIISVDPQPFTVIGRSIIDLTRQSQDNETSLLRIIIDNAHMANNPRPVVDPTRVHMEDILNNRIGAPVRMQGNEPIQFLDIPNTAQQLLPFLQWMEKDAETKVGVTKAARGLDPDAMQSTDKNAVLNTIELSQGQVELIVRNIVETGLIPLFKKMLKLSIRHMPKNQFLMHKGAVVPVDLSTFNADMMCEPNVGLGTAAPEQQLLTLNFVYNEQKQYMEQYGLDNPFTSLSKMYNCLEDMIELGGVVDAGRYFNEVTPEMEQIIGQAQAQQQEQARQEELEQQPMDPSKAHIIVEQGKTRAKQLELMVQSRMKSQELAQKSLEAAEKLDIERDRLVQDRVVNLAKIENDSLDHKIQQEQAANDSDVKKRAQSGAG